jgi:hypothetical protein
MYIKKISLFLIIITIHSPLMQAWSFGISSILDKPVDVRYNSNGVWQLVSLKAYGQANATIPDNQSIQSIEWGPAGGAKIYSIAIPGASTTIYNGSFSIGNNSSSPNISMENYSYILGSTFAEGAATKK